jgi:MoaA/NifB/PqqE/SkfB family radical SAM enzyme
MEKVKNVLIEAKKLGTVTCVSIEGGEPFLYYPIMIKTAAEASRLGFLVEILSNCYWATCVKDAEEWLRPVARFNNAELSFSGDVYHGEEWETELVKNAVKAAKALGIKTDIIAIKYPKAKTQCPKEIEGAKIDLCELMYKGRAACELTNEAEKKPWSQFTKCPYENLAEPERVHIDPFGNVHVCQGISIGNAWLKPFSKIIKEYNPTMNPILEPLIRGGPVALVEKFKVPHDEVYADACHLCFMARCVLREKHPETLGPDQMYGEPEEKKA